MDSTRYISLRLGERIISALPGDLIRVHDHSTVELLPGYQNSGLIISHDGNDLLLRFSSFTRFKLSLSYVRK